MQYFKFWIVKTLFLFQLLKLNSVFGLYIQSYRP